MASRRRRIDKTIVPMNDRPKTVEPFPSGSGIWLGNSDQDTDEKIEKQAETARRRRYVKRRADHGSGSKSAVTRTKLRKARTNGRTLWVDGNISISLKFTDDTGKPMPVLPQTILANEVASIRAKGFERPKHWCFVAVESGEYKDAVMEWLVNPFRMLLLGRVESCEDGIAVQRFTNDRVRIAFKMMFPDLSITFGSK